MAKKLNPEAVGLSEMSEYLGSASSFGFELSVVRMLREADISCLHSGHYKDPATGISREFDIRTKTIRGARAVRMAIECKAVGDNFPVLITCTPRSVEDSWHKVLLCGKPEPVRRYMGLPADPLTPSWRSVHIAGEYSIYRAGEPVGKSVTQVGRDTKGNLESSDNELFNKWGQCLGSAADLVVDSAEAWNGEYNQFFTSMVIPIVVLPDERLWVANYNDEGTIEGDPIQTNRCSCFVGEKYEIGHRPMSGSTSLSHIEFLTLSGLRSFVTRYVSSEEGFDLLLSEDGIIRDFDSY